MILTVTANIAIDRTYVIDHLEVGAVHKVAEVFAHTGGKGVNVSRTVAALGGMTTVTGFIGADSFDDATRELAAAGLGAALFVVEGPARQTVTVTARDGTTTAFDEPGPLVGADKWAWFERHVDGLLPGVDLVVIAGSLPPGSPDQSLANLCRLANAHEVPVILDARGPAMRAAQSETPLVAKLNRSELAQTLERDMPTDEQVLDGAMELHHQGAQSVLVTLGAEGAIALNADGAWRITHPPAEGNPIGAGDAFSAALALALVDRQPFDQALKQGTAAALASLGAPTAGAIDPEDMRRALPTVHIHEIARAA